MTLLELEKFLNSKITKFIGEKVEMSGDFHTMVARCVNDALLEVGLDDVLEYRPWRVILKYEHIKYLTWDLEKVFNINVDLKRDKRYKTQSVGVINDIVFTPFDDDTLSLTVPELIKYKQIKSKKILLDNYEDDLKAKLAEIEKLNGKITELKTELETLQQTML